MRKKWILIGVLLLMAITPLIDVTKVQAAKVLFDGTSSAEQLKALASINKIRQQMGLEEVKLDPALVKAAINHARYANANFTIKSEGDLSIEVKGREFFTQQTPKERVLTSGLSGEVPEIMETVYMKERAYDEFDMASEINELAVMHDRREVMLTPAVASIGIARVGKSTVIVGAVKSEGVMTTPATASVFPYDGMTRVWSGNIYKMNAQQLIQGEATTLTVFSSLRDVADIKAKLSTQAGNRHISIPLSVKKLNSGYGYVLTAQRQLRGDREYTAEVSFQSGGETLVKKWTFKTSPFLYQLNIDDMPLLSAPPLNIVNGISEVPMRYLFELFGARVEWNKATRTITAEKNGLSLKMTIDDHTAYINGQAVQMNSPPHLYGYATYVPLRFISETFGYDVEYDPIERSVDIWTGLL
ncbi:stalk domain-containing protein [Paenibacillus sp. FSL R5-0470]|uniref:stalk domain-containing protein n=1 Tax=Paenibacillus sp. FSL R5-0470 TaxID=2921641 RepID=UPI0030DB32E5